MVASVQSRVDDPHLIEKRRAQIVSAAIELFGRFGYHRTTIRDIASLADVSIGLIYQYVRDKEDVLLLALDEVLNGYLRAIPAALRDVEDPMLRFRAAATAYCQVVDRNIDATVLAYRETKALRPEHRELIKSKELETNDLIAACIRDCVAAGLFRQINVELFTYQIVMFAHTWALKRWRFADLMSLEQYLDDGLDLLLDSVLTPRGRRRLQRQAGGATLGQTP